MAVFDAVICKHFSVHAKKALFSDFARYDAYTRVVKWDIFTLRCSAPFWLIQCKPYRNRFIIAKVIDKSLGARFLWPTVQAYFQQACYAYKICDLLPISSYTSEINKSVCDIGKYFWRGH